MSNTFTITGIMYFSDVLLKADVVSFEPDSKLVIGPAERRPTCPKTLTIIAQRIEIPKGIGEITYDSDGDGLIDADTPAPNWASAAYNGAAGDNKTGEGSYPLAEDGGNGKPGGQGIIGNIGTNAPALEIWVNEITGEGKLKIDLKGQDGGKGQQGGNGGPGGQGQKGAKSQTSDSWYDGDQCDREPGQGGRGGKGGDAGYPGTGGNGGNGGIVHIFTTKNNLAKANAWAHEVAGGRGGHPGDRGIPGKGGKGGQQGDISDPCRGNDAFNGRDGADGRTVDQIDVDWVAVLSAKNYVLWNDRKGNDGKGGYYQVNEIEEVPI